MEVLLIAGLTSAVGYYLNKDGIKTPRKVDALRNDVSPNDLPNSDNIYASDRYNEVDKYVRAKADIKWQQSFDPTITGVIPPLYNTYGTSGMSQSQIGNIPVGENLSQQGKYADISKFTNVNRISDSAQKNINTQPMFRSVQFTEQPVGQSFTNPEILGNTEISILTGLPIQKSHQNMVPFFGSTIKQNMDFGANKPLLERYTGVNTETYIKKTAPSPLFAPVKQNIYADPDTTSQQLDRFIPSNFRTNESPIASIMVGAPISGTIDNQIRPIYKNIDQLEVNPRQSYDGRLLDGQKEIQINSVNNIGSIEKRTPDNFKITSSIDFLPNKSPQIKPNAQKNYHAKHTLKQDMLFDYSGNANGLNDINKTQPRYISENSFLFGKQKQTETDDILETIYKDDHRNTLNYSNDRNLYAKELNFVDDYGRENFDVNETERETTGQTRYILNANKASLGNDIRYCDDAKGTVKQTTIKNNHNGFLNSEFDRNETDAFDLGINRIQVPVTQKQTALNKNYIGTRFRNEGKGYANAKYHAQATVKQTTLHSNNGNLQTEHKATSLYDAYKNVQNLRNPATLKDYRGGVTSSFNKPSSRTEFMNMNLNDRKEVLSSNSRPNGPQIFQADAGKSYVGDISLRDTKMLSEETDNREWARTKNYLPTPSKNLVFLDQTMNVKLEQTEQLNDRFDPSIFDAQHNGNTCEIDIRKSF